MKIIEGYDFADIYENWIKEILFDPDYNTSQTLEKLNFGFVLKSNLDKVILKNHIRSANIRYLKGELLWYLSGRRDLEFIQKYSKFWNQIANKDNTLNSAYGYLLFVEKNQFGYTQWEWAKITLINSIDTRQAMMFFNKPHYFYDGNKDFICTQYAIFHIRNNRLYLTIHMRSSDAKFGLTYDIPFFTLLQRLMLLELKERYPLLQLGNFNFLANSAHIYHRDEKLFAKMIQYPFETEKMPKLKENPILHPDLLNKNKVNDKFINWLQEVL